MGELTKKLKAYADSDLIPMHMPGHKRRLGELGNPYFLDMTEVEGLDDLHHADSRSTRSRSWRIIASTDLASCP